MKDHENRIQGEQTAQQEPRLRLVPFNEITMGADPGYLIKDLIPRVGLTIAWGKPKCGKSFWAFDATMHVALGWEYRGRRVQQGTVVYVIAEGASGFRIRVEAFRQTRLEAFEGPVPFNLVPAKLDMLTEHDQLIAAIRIALDDTNPAVVVLDTLNRTLYGSENEDMPAYVQAVDAVREAFDCAVLIIHHCGIDGSRPRGHSSLTAAADAQIAITRTAADNVVAIVEYMKDGPEGARIVSRLSPVQVGTDTEGDSITSCIVEPVEEADTPPDTGPKLTANQETALAMVIDAGKGGIATEDWNDQLRAAGIGTNRHATLWDIQRSLKKRGLVYESSDRWFVK